jgi:hypothetical protein
MTVVHSTFTPKALRLRDARDVVLDRSGFRSFSVATRQGELVVTEMPRCREIRGGAGALVAYGLVMPEWLPGFPGNNTTRQTVVLADSGAWLIYGNRAGSKLDMPHIVICRLSAKTFIVELAYSADEQAVIDVFYREQWERQREAKRAIDLEASERARKEDAERAEAKKTIPEWLGERCRYAEISMSVVMDLVGTGRFRYSDDSLNRILAARDNLLSAIAGGRVIQAGGKPAYEQSGNVVRLPKAATR